MKKPHCTAIVLAAGQGKRMGTKVHKQYLLLEGKPVLYYSLKVFQESDIIDEVILVTGKDEEAYCMQEIIQPNKFTKVTHIIEGGAERYHSVWNGLQKIQDEGYVFIHDGARPFIDEEMISRAYACVQKEKACVVGEPMKATVKIIDEDGYISYTPAREKVWMVQTPQVFETMLVKSAYAKLMENETVQVTDDAMVVETFGNHKVKLIEGSYKNIKITTPDDLERGALFLK